MNRGEFTLALVCVAMITSGQILFKKSGMEIQESNSWFTLRNCFFLGMAFAIYAAATLLWVSLLRSMPLSRAYVFMSLSFVIVPVAGYFVFGENLSLSYMVGAILIVIGILVASRT